MLQLFMSNPNRSFYVREITRKIDEQINSVRRELANLLAMGIISSDTNNNRLYYEVNQKYKFFRPLQEIFGNKVSAASDVTESNSKGADPAAGGELKFIGNIELALYTGQFTRDESSGIDFLVVGDINPNQLNKFIAELEKSEGKEVRYAVMPLDEFTYRQQINDRFLTTVLNSKYQLLVDKQNLLRIKNAKPSDEKPKRSKKEE